MARQRCASDASAGSDAGETGIVVKGLRRGSWEMIQDSSLGVYFYNYRTSDSQWEAPDCFAEDVRCCGYATARIPPPPRTQLAYVWMRGSARLPLGCVLVCRQIEPRVLEEEEGPDQSTSLGDADSPVSSTGSNRMLTLKRAETLAKHVLQVCG